jgi:hypothetical protein
MKKLFYLLPIYCLTQCAQAQVSEKEIIACIKLTPASILDSVLPGGRFENWLEGILGQSADVQWELNDCGEQTGEPAIDALRDIPMCVGVYANLADHRELGIMISTGTFKKGLMPDPAVYDIYLKTGKEFQFLRRLSELEKALKHSPSK